MVISERDMTALLDCLCSLRMLIMSLSVPGPLDPVGGLRSLLCCRSNVFTYRQSKIAQKCKSFLSQKNNRLRLSAKKRKELAGGGKQTPSLSCLPRTVSSARTTQQHPSFRGKVSQEHYVTARDNNNLETRLTFFLKKEGQHGEDRESTSLFLFVSSSLPSASGCRIRAQPPEVLADFRGSGNRANLLTHDDTNLIARCARARNWACLPTISSIRCRHPSLSVAARHRQHGPAPPPFLCCLRILPHPHHGGKTYVVASSRSLHDTWTMCRVRKKHWK